MPAYRPSLVYLSALLCSVRNQTNTPASVVITQDPDLSGEVLEPSLLPDPGVPTTFMVNSSRLGMVGNWNHCVGLADTDLVILMGQDDVLEPGACHHHINTLRQHVRTAISCSIPSYITADGQPRRTNQRSVSPDRLFDPDSDFDLTYRRLVDLALLYGNVTGEPCGSCFRKSAWQAVGGYSVHFGHSADLDLVLRLARLSSHVALTTRAC